MRKVRMIVLIPLVCMLLGSTALAAPRLVTLDSGDWKSLKDAAKAIEAALIHGRVGQIYNISGESIPHREINETISRLAKKSSWRINFPAFVMIIFAYFLEIFAKFTQREPFYPLNLTPYVFEDWIVSSDKAKRDLGFESLSFEEGANQTLEWYQSVGCTER